MDRTALQIAANPEVVECFQTLPRQEEGNYFTDHPIEKNKMKKLLESYNFKSDGHARICLYNMYDDFVCTANRAVTDAGITYSFQSEDYAEVEKHFSEEDTYIYYRQPTSDILAYGEPVESQYFSIVREIKDYFASSSSWGYIEVQESTDKIDEIFSDLGDEVKIELLDQNGQKFYERASFSCMQDDEKKKDTSNLSLSNFGITGKSAELALKQFDSFMKDGTVRQEECRKWLSTLLCYFMPEFKDEENNSQLEEMIANLFLYSANTSELSQNLRRMLDEKNIYKRENTTADIMEEMENYIKKHMTEAVTAAELAERFGLVAPYLSKLFKEYSGYTPPQYLQKIRLDQAKKLLESEQNYLAKDVAEMVGYPNPLYFSKVFKKNIGIYPSEYRKKYREGSGESK